MATKVKKTTATLTVTDTDLAAVEAARKALGPVTLKGAVSQAAILGNVPTPGGIQRSLMAFFWSVGVDAKKGGTKKVDIRPMFNAWADAYYDQSVPQPRKRPKAKSMTDICNSYGKFANLPLSLPYDTWPIAKRAMADRNLSLLGRASKVETLREAHPEAAPSTSELEAPFAAKAKRDTKYNINGALRGVCSAIEKKLKDAKFVDALPEAGIKGTYFKMLAEAAASLRFHVTEADKQAKVKKETDALFAKLASVADLRAKGKNGAAVH